MAKNNPLNELAAGLVEAFGLKYEEAVENLKDPMLRWLDFRLRYIEPKPRQILKSDGFDARVPTDALAGLQAFEARILAGENLNPFQSATMKKHDTSGGKQALRTDLLWSDWGISHAHLTVAPPAAGQEYAARSKWLVFFLHYEDVIALIDVRDHNEPGVFEAFDLVEKTIRSWPEQAKKWQLNGILGLAREPDTSGQTIKALRRGGVNSAFEVDGAFYMGPGMGVTSASTALKTTMTKMNLVRIARAILERVNQPDGDYRKKAIEKGSSNPVFEFAVSTDGDLILRTPDEKDVFRFSIKPDRNDPWTKLVNDFMPKWAGNQLVAWHAAQQPIAPSPATP